LPALRRPTLCVTHAKGRREDEPQGVRPPQGSSDCTVCRAEAADKLALRDTGTATSSREISTFDPDASYTPQSERARKLVAAHLAQEQETRIEHEDAIARLDAERPDVIALDHARAGRERIDTYRRQRRLPRVPRPRWYG
jgi:hypothetical protein